MNREIPIFGDEYVDMEFGTGCVKVTPCHDPNDFEMGQRHNLEQILVFNEDATVNANGGKYEGMDRYECRKAVVKDLEEGGYLVKIEDHEHNVGTCYRCGTTVEPMTSAQWFVKMAPLAKPAMDVVNEGKTKFVPDRFSKTYLRWMENVHDWCISRQLWWGHRIPAFYCDDCGEMTVSKTDVRTCPKCGGKHIRQEEDVLDTWFSSALWPFSTLGWPDKTKELDYFYPTSTLVTGYDIIFFWVARMIFSGVEHMGETPFKTVYIHGLVRDAQGRKMSKSLGNGIDPLEVIDQYGADALRFTLATGNSPGNDMRFSDERVQASRNFCNKIWNASRFIQMNLTIDKDKAVELPSDLAHRGQVDRQQVQHAGCRRYPQHRPVRAGSGRCQAERLHLGELLRLVYRDRKDPSADRRRERTEGAVLRAVAAQCSCCTRSCRSSPRPSGRRCRTRARPSWYPAWPEYKDELHFAAEEAQMESLMDAVRAIRNRRAEMNVPPSKKAKVLILTEKKDTFSAGAGFFPKLAYASEIELIDAVPADAAKMASVVTGDAQIYMPMGDLIDFEAERARLGKEKSKVEADIDFVMKKLNNPKFVDKAPEKVVAAEREKADKLREHLAKLEESIAALG